MNTLITEKSPSVVLLLKAIAQEPGLSAVQLAERTGYSVSHTKGALSVARKTGNVLPVMVTQRTMHWFPTEQAQALMAKKEAVRAEKARRRAARLAVVTDRARILEMSSRPDGVKMGEIKAMGVKEHSASRHICALIQRGQLFRAARPGCRMRWFDAQSRADAWSAMPAPKQSEWHEPGIRAWEDHPARRRRMAAIGERIKSSARQPSKAPPLLKGSQRNKPGAELVVQQKPGKAAPVSIKASKAQAAIDFSKAKKTIIDPPPFVCRWQQQPDSGQSIFADWPRYGTGA